MQSVTFATSSERFRLFNLINVRFIVLLGCKIMVVKRNMTLHNVIYFQIANDPTFTLKYHGCLLKNFLIGFFSYLGVCLVICM